jgi:hypothetical protein
MTIFRNQMPPYLEDHRCVNDTADGSGKADTFDDIRYHFFISGIYAADLNLGACLLKVSHNACRLGLGRAGS